MSELSSFTQRSTRVVLSSQDLAAIQQRVGRNHRGLDAPALDFELTPDGLVFGVVPLVALPSTWVGWGVSPRSSGVGVCMPVHGVGYIGVALNRRGDAAWFSIDDSNTEDEAVSVWGDSPPACQLLEDLCRVRLGLPTLPPERRPDWYWLGRWLSEIAQSERVDAGRWGEPTNDLLDVVSIATMHPAVDHEELHGLDVNGLAGFVVERHRTHVEIADWQCIHLDAAGDRHHPFHEFALALDTGAFSRWISASSAPLSDLAAGLTTRCSSLGLRLVGAVIADIVLRHRIER